MSLDRSSALPLWAQLETALRVRLEGGEFAERFPTDHQLVEEYGVSRQTVREAIRHLNRTGILRRERGRGTVVNTAEFEQPLGALYSLFGSIESTGVEQRSDVLALESTVEPAIAAQLDLADDTSLLFLERVRFAADEPLAIDRAWLPMAIAGRLLDSSFEHAALYDELERCCGTRPDAGWERIAPIVPDPRDRGLLRMAKGKAAFFLERRSTAAGRPIEWRTTVIRGDRYRFVSKFELGVAPGLVATRTE